MTATRISITIDDGLVNVAKSKHKNLSKYFSDLATKDLLGVQQSSPYEEFRDMLLSDVKFLELLQNQGGVLIESTVLGPNPFHPLALPKGELWSKDLIEHKKVIDEFADAQEAGKAADTSMGVAQEMRCCALAKPCIHWQYNNTQLVWMNSLSGREREPDM